MYVTFLMLFCMYGWCQKSLQCSFSGIKHNLEGMWIQFCTNRALAEINRTDGESERGGDWSPEHCGRVVCTLTERFCRIQRWKHSRLIPKAWAGVCGVVGENSISSSFSWTPAVPLTHLSWVCACVWEARIDPFQTSEAEIHPRSTIKINTPYISAFF